MGEPTEACVLCGVDRATAVIVLSSKSGFTRWVCASSVGCRHRRQVKAAYVEGVAEGRRQAAEAIRAADTYNWPGSRSYEVAECQVIAARIAEGTDRA